MSCAPFLFDGVSTDRGEKHEMGNTLKAALAKETDAEDGKEGDEGNGYVLLLSDTKGSSNQLLSVQF